MRSVTVAEAVAAAHADDTNSFIEVDDSALEVDPRPGPLTATPVAIKDLIDQAGHTTTAGSAFYRHQAQATAPAIGRLERAGAVVIGRTNLHEFAFGFSSENPWFGPVLNPWDHSLAAGGSSGGSAAAVAAGIVPIAIGTDTGGSVRVPAALCAVTGLKVTHGLIPLDGVFPLVPSFDTVGAIADSLDALEAATAAMAGDEWPQPPPAIDRLRLVVPGRWVESAPLDSATEAAFAGFVEAAAGFGAEVGHDPLPELGPSSHQAALIAREVAPIHAAWRRAGRPYGADVGERVDAALELAENGPSQSAATSWGAEVTRTMHRATADGSLLITPTVASLDKRIGEDRIGDHHYRAVLSWFTAPVNPTGLPALTIPVAGPGRMPSVQIIGPPRGERLLLAVARTLLAAGILGPGRLPSE
ncbi:MAG TPA: amidase [Acidimicrobiia bacterium]|nr:amidase [Acidimicrobiia bacterium]